MPETTTPPPQITVAEFAQGNGLARWQIDALRAHLADGKTGEHLALNDRRPAAALEAALGVALHGRL